jgi:hypothetical protein
VTRRLARRRASLSPVCSLRSSTSISGEHYWPARR